MKSTLNFEERNRILNIAIASSKIKELHLPHIQIRPNMHICIAGRVGGGKSSILKEVMDAVGIESGVTSLTKATLLGAVDKNTGQFLPPATWEFRNGIMPIDELHIPKEGSGRDVARTMVSLMEQPRYKKGIGYRCNDYNKKDGDLFCRVKDNQIDVKTRFSIFSTTMMNLNNRAKMQNVDVQAFMTRCIVIHYYPDIKELLEISKGNRGYKYEKLEIKNNGVIYIKDNIYTQIINYVESKIDLIGEDEFLRTIGELCRCYAVVGKIVISDFEAIIKTKIATN